jgi:hypothetical protein
MEPAIVISSASAAVALGGLAWQLTLFKLSGARLRVQMVFAYRDDLGSTFSVSEGRRMQPDWEKVATKFQARGIEFVVVRVTNIGRTAVSVENISLDVGRSRWWRRIRRTITPNLFVDPNSDEDPPETKRPVRLEPGANVSVPLHLWPAAEAAARGRERYVLRGSAHAVGRRVTRSKWKYRWVFRVGDQTRFANLTVGAELLLYRVMWRHQADLVVTSHLTKVLELLGEGSDHNELRRFLDQLEPEGIHATLAYDLHEAFHRTQTTA